MYQIFALAVMCALAEYLFTPSEKSDKANTVNSSEVNK